MYEGDQPDPQQHQQGSINPVKLVLLTRFHSHHNRSGFIIRLVEEALKMGHTLTVVNPTDVVLDFNGNPNSLPIRWGTLAFPDADLILPSARWDDAHTWQVVETLMAWQQPVIAHNRVPLGDHITMARILAKRGIPTPRTWVLSSAAQLAIVLQDLSFPCLMRSRYGGQGRRLVVIQHSGEAYSTAESLSAQGQPFMVQELANPLGEDIRVMIVGDKVVAAVHRMAPEGFVRPKESGNREVTTTTLTAQEEKIALAAAQMYGAPFCAVSLLRTQGQPLLLEVSRVPTLDELEKTSGENLAAMVVRYLAQMAEVRKMGGQPSSVVTFPSRQQSNS